MTAIAWAIVVAALIMAPEPSHPRWIGDTLFQLAIFMIAFINLCMEHAR